MNNREKRKKENRIMLIISICIFLLLLGTYAAIDNYKINSAKEDRLNRLSNDYQKSLKKSNGIKGSDTTFRDQDGNIIKEYKGTTDISFDEKGKKELLNKKADQVINKFVNSINSGDYDSIYSLFNKEYIDVFQYTEDEFKNKYVFEGGASYQITNVEEKDKNLIATIKFIEKNTGYIMLEDFTLYEDGTIADIPIYHVQEINKKTTYEGVTYIVKSRYESRLGSIFDIEIDNKSQTIIDVDNMLIKDEDEIKTYEIISKDKDIKAYPGTPFRFLIKLPNTDTITNLQVRYKDLDGNTKKVEIYSKD